MKQGRIWDFPDKDSDMPLFSRRWQFIEITGQKTLKVLFGKFRPKIAFFRRAFSLKISMYWRRRRLPKNGSVKMDILTYY